ncbi:hypothetical protein LCGC14_1787930 [marine sediment metagenome]|uniref:Uncharacterized protein n=1 Tax=marine sediment metagenome TaxID=412755 RepID=A0A0F9JT13_9ZZZZ
MPYSFTSIELNSMDQLEVRVQDGKYALGELRIKGSGALIFRDAEAIENFTSALLQLRRQLEMPATGLETRLGSQRPGPEALPGPEAGSPAPSAP